MRGKRVFIGLRALAIFAVTLLVTSTWAVTVWREKVLHSLDGPPSPSLAGLIFDAAGNLYGTTEYAGFEEDGTAFELTPTGSGDWTETVLHIFCCSTGYNPSAGLIFDAAGNLYGTTGYGGAYHAGTVFELTPAGGGRWTETVLHSFHNGTDGAYPYAALVFDASGNLFGTTAAGGTFDCGDYGCGTVFELTPTQGGGWTETVLHSFGSAADGNFPMAKLIFDAAGNLYGTTRYGGAGDCIAYPTFGCGTVFELTPAGGGQWTETVLYSFANNGMDGTYPVAGLIFNAAGGLYGTTYAGGAYDVGTVFALTTTPAGAWTETVLHNFDYRCSAGWFCADTDGYSPAAGLILDAAGDLYGTTAQGGTNNLGTVFELMPTEGGGWTEALLYHFCSQTDCMDGAEPLAGLIFDASGNLYGTTSRTSLGNSGTVFELTPVYPCINCSHDTPP